MLRMKSHSGFFLLSLSCLVLSVHIRSAFSANLNVSVTDPAELYGESEEEVILTNSTRDGRVFPFLAVVKLGNERCTSNMGEGVCKTKKQCEKEGGVSTGSSCGQGSGVCCMISVSCSAKNNGNPVVVRNSGAHITPPNSYDPPLQCRFDIPKKNGYCQIRLDFITFSLSQPDSNGDCVDDSMTITGADNIKNMIICGENKGQHLYLHYGASDRISINLNLNMQSRNYDILVTQLKCSSSSSSSKKRTGKKFQSSSKGDDNDDEDSTVQVEAAPFGCTQYYTKSSDSVRSFNYAKAVDVSNYLGPTTQLDNQQYTVCVKTLTGSNQITWAKCSADDAFVITDSPSNPAANGALTSITGSQCVDYVDIYGSPAGRYCGTDFPNMVTSSAKPYALYVNFDSTENPALTADIDPRTGCCVGCHCEYRGSPVLGDGLDDPNASLPCQTNPVDQTCVVDDYLASRTDYYNLGFCLTYRIS